MPVEKHGRSLFYVSGLPLDNPLPRFFGASFYFLNCRPVLDSAEYKKIITKMCSFS